MFRNRFWGGLLALLFFLTLAGIIGFAGYQMGLMQGAGGEFAGPRGELFHPHHGFFFPFFLGFGLLKFFFILLLIGLFFRLVFRPWRMGPGGHWRGDHDGPWGSRLKEMHDRWHEGQTDPPGTE
jgi:hypothetical protein